MGAGTQLEQHIAVFGESGSGKTVLVSSFYGAMQEPEFLRTSLFDVIADDPGQGHRLHGNYLGMRDSARRPEPTRFSATTYAFSVRLKNAMAASKSPFEAVRLIWHDYPGEWFEADVSGPEEAQRRLSTFRALLGSDVALLLVDGQRMLDHAGEEERYLKSLLSSFRTGLLRLKGELLDEGAPLVRFPRIWVLALSKADLLPDVDVFAFRDLVIGKAADDVAELRRVIASMVESPEALSLGEDSVLFSSARFEPNRIEVATRIGLDLVLPMAAMLPFERHVRWAEQRQIRAKVAQALLQNASPVAVALLGKAKFAGPKGLLVGLLGARALQTSFKVAADLGGDQLQKLHDAALARQDDAAAVLAGLRLGLERGERDRVLLRSRR